MFEATYISACVLGIIFTGAWLAVNARWDRDRAITCTKGIPNNAPIWYHIKDDHQKLYVIGSGHTPLIVGGNITLAFFASISFAVGSFVPIIFAVIFFVPFEMWVSRDVSIKARRITRIVLD